MQDLSITETRSATPNKLTFRALRWVPTYGMEVVATLGSRNRKRRMFGGTVLNVRESSSGQLRVFDAECVDWTWSLDNGPSVYGHYTGTYDAIARQLMSEYAPLDFTVQQVESGLPTVTGGITFTGVKLSKALQRLEKRARGAGINVTQFIDYNKDLYFRVTANPFRTSPRTITGSLDTLKSFQVLRDLSQVANRVPFEGGGANALTEVAIGETILPLTDAPDYWYGDVGGVVVSGPQKITYTARVVGGGGSVVGPGQAPTNAPTLALAAGSGVTSGAHSVTVVWKTASGRTRPGPAATITVGNIAAPSVTPVASAPSSGDGPNDGTHEYAMTFVTSSGETTAGPRVSRTTSSRTVSAPSGPPNVVAPSTMDWTEEYVPGDSLYYVVTYVIAGGGETTPTAASSTVVAQQSTAFPGSIFKSCPIDWSNIPVPSDAAVIAKRIYRNRNGSWVGYREMSVSITSDNDAGPVTAAGSPPGSNTAQVITRQVPLSNLEVPTSPLVTSKKIYGTAAGSSQLKFIASIAVGTTSYTVTMTDGSLGANVPTSNTATANQIALSGVAVGPSGTTEREIYMSPAGGGTRRKALTIANNTATTGTITISDATLAGEDAEPDADTSGLTQPAGQVLPGETSIIIAGTAPFRETGGWAFTGTQQIRYTAFSGSSLTGIPASGPGSIQQPINYNSTIAAAPCLIGIPSSGEGSIRYTIPKGEAVYLRVTVEDTDAQVALQTLLSAAAPVVRECAPLRDHRVKRDEAITRASAFLALRAYGSTSAGPFRTKDTNTTAGATMAVNVTSPAQVNDTFKVQSVTISNFTPNIPPDYVVQASDELFSIEDLLSGGEG